MSFANKTIRNISEDEDKAKDAYGLAVAKTLQTRLADIRAARFVTDLLVGQPREVKNGICSNYRVDLCDGYYLEFEANHIKSSHIENGVVNWSKVTRIKILLIENANGKSN